MSIKAIFYAYVLGGLTFLPLLVCAAIAWTIYTSVPVGDPDPAKLRRRKLAREHSDGTERDSNAVSTNDQQRPRKGWLTVRRTFEEREMDSSYMSMMRSFLDSRSNDPKRSRPKDMWYVVLKGNVLYLYEDETMQECEAAIQVSAHSVVVYPEGLADGELFTKRSCICLKPIVQPENSGLGSVTKEMGYEPVDIEKKIAEMGGSKSKKEKERARLEEIERVKEAAKAEALDAGTPWFIFVRLCVEFEDWFIALVNASNESTESTLEPLFPVFRPEDMDHLVHTLDEAPDVIPTRWLNALLGRVFFSFYRTQHLESFIIGRLMKKLSKVKTPTFLQNIAVTEVSVGNNPPFFSKPMLKDLTKEGDASLEIRVSHRGEIRLTVEATAIINLGQRFKTYSVKLVLAVVLRKLEGNLLVKVKRPPSNRIWYAFTHPPEMELDVEPVVSERQLKWGMICSTIESRLREIINESVVLPNMDDIAFFDSLPLQNRGGIWADACRKAYREESDVESGSDSKGRTDNPISSPMKSFSTDAITTGISGDSLAEVEQSQEESASVPDMALNSGKRQSWFGKSSQGPSGLLAEENSKSLEDVPDEEEPPLEDSRGRSLNVDTTIKRAASVPATKTSPISNADVESPFPIQDASTSASEASQDASSHSRGRSLSSGANVLGSEAGSSKESLSQKAVGSSNTSNFFSTLKSRTDKQALSNTAKEAMRKWSANWNGFKRDHLNNQNGQANPEEPADGIPQSSTSSIFSFPTKNKNYADIRAAVANRKGKEQESEAEVDRSSPSTPIDIPKRENGDNFEQEHETSTSLDKAGDELSTSVSPTSSHRRDRTPSLLQKDRKRASILPPKVTTATQSIENLPQSPADLTPPEPIVKAPPIQTQPSQGASMVIPGIHASHRGDVQSLGYTPPAPSAPEKKPRTQTIQNMYKLFRTPTASSSSSRQHDQYPGETQPSISPSPSPRGSTELEANGSPTPRGTPSERPAIPASSSDSTVQKGTPPPLPPRSSADSRPRPSSVSYSDSPIASATDALKHIAEQDETKRKDIEAFTSAPGSLSASPSPERRARDRGEDKKAKRLSPQLPSPKRSKRTSLGARRITTSVVSEEPEQLSTMDMADPTLADSRGGQNQTTQRDEGAEVTSQNRLPEQPEETGPQSQTTSTRPVPAPPKLAPPPLPPRKSSSSLPTLPPISS